jgi:hypothetical protein
MRAPASEASVRSRTPPWHEHPADKIVTEKEAERYIGRVEEHRELLRRTQEQQRAKSGST